MCSPWNTSIGGDAWLPFAFAFWQGKPVQGIKAADGLLASYFMTPDHRACMTSVTSSWGWEYLPISFRKRREASNLTRLTPILLLDRRVWGIKICYILSYPIDGVTESLLTKDPLVRTNGVVDNKSGAGSLWWSFREIPDSTDLSLTPLETGREISWHLVFDRESYLRGAWDEN